MGAYTFDRFRREYRNVGVLSLPERFCWWLNRIDPPWRIKQREVIAEASRIADAVGNAMSLAERDHPGSMNESRRREVAAAARMTDEDLSALLSAYDWFSKTASQRTRQWWLEMAIHTSFLLGLPLLVLLAVGLMALFVAVAISN